MLVLRADIALPSSREPRCHAVAALSAAHSDRKPATHSEDDRKVAAFTSEQVAAFPPERVAALLSE
jgi:hypothetical protein